MGETRVKDFSMPLSDLGKPDEEFFDEDFSDDEADCPSGLVWFVTKICHATAMICRRIGVVSFVHQPNRLVKWTVQEPTGRKRRHGFSFDGLYRAEVHFTGKLLDGTVFASSRENGTPLLLSCYGEDVMYGFSRAVRSMQPGEKSIFRVPEALALAMYGCPASIPWNIPPDDQTLRFDIELISFITDILRDQGILKKIIKLGEETWGHPTGFDEVFVNYNACLKDGTSVSKSEEIEFTVREGFFCPAFAHAVETMEKGEEAILIVKPECKNIYKLELFFE